MPITTVLIGKIVAGRHSPREQPITCRGSPEWGPTGVDLEALRVRQRLSDDHLLERPLPSPLLTTYIDSILL